MIRRATILAAAVLTLAAGCADGTGSRAVAHAPVTISGVLTPDQQALVAGMSVEVTGAGIGTPIIADLAVNGAQVNGTVTVPVGPTRTFTVRAFDAQGVETYEGSATATVVAGTNPPLAVRLLAREGSVPIDVTIGTYAVTLTPPMASVAVDGEVTLTATVTASDDTTPTGAMTWGVLNPALVTVTVAPGGRSAVVRGRIAGSTRVVASYDGVAAATALTITVAPPINRGPEVRINGPYTGKAGVAIAFSSAGTVDPDGTITAYRWDFGDGTSSTQANPLKSYAAAGTYSVTLSATDNGGITNTVPTTATIGPPNQAPTASISGPLRATAGVPVTLSASGADVDGSVAGFVWAVFDGMQQSFTTTTGSLTYTFNTVGTYGVAVAAVDNDGLTGRSASTTVTVEAAPPAGYLAATRVSAGASFACAVTSAGNAYCWGANDVGQLGNGGTSPSSRPVAVRMPAGVTFTSLRSGARHSCAGGSDGNTYCWGGNEAGQLGFGDTQPRTQPTAVPLETRPGSMGYAHSCNERNGTYYCWGAGYGLAPVAQPAPSGSSIHFRVAGGSQTCMYVQVAIPNPPFDEQKIISCPDVGGVQVTVPIGVSMGSLYPADGYACHTYASQGGMRCFGSNGSGQWGTGTTGSATMATLTSYVPSAFGSGFTCSSTSCAGSNASGQLGNGSTASFSFTPTAISGGSMSTIVASAGGAHACGIRGGNAYCWGNNASGQLGDGTTTQRRVPTAVVPPAP